MFEGFTLEMVELPEATLRVRHGGSGSPVLLLHGHPRTHATWHRVAPLLALTHTVVCPDLRGFGQSSKPHDSALAADFEAHGEMVIQRVRETKPEVYLRVVADLRKWCRVTLEGGASDEGRSVIQ